MSAAHGAPVSSPKVASPQFGSPAKSAETPSPVLGTEEKLQQIVLGLYGYEFAHEHFPPAVVIGPDGKTPHSWRVEILPYLHRKDLFEQYRLDEPWDSPPNKKVLDQIPDVFRSPYDDPKSTNSGYFVVVGPGAAFEGAKGLRFTDLTDNHFITLIVVESRRNTPWTKPEDIPFDPAGPLPELGGFVKGQFAFATAAHSTQKVNFAKIQNRLRWLILRNDGNLFVFDDAVLPTAILSGRTGLPIDRTDRGLANLKALGLAMRLYHDAHFEYPRSAVLGPDGKTPHSWRVELLPYLNQKELYAKYRLDEPWDSPANKRVLEDMPDVFRSPYDDPKSTHAGYYVLVGPGTLFEPGMTLRINDVLARLSSALVILEARPNVPWTKPEDLPFDPEKSQQDLSRFLEARVAFLTADGVPRTLEKERFSQILKPLALRSDPQVVDLNPPSRPINSPRHPSSAPSGVAPRTSRPQPSPSADKQARTRRNLGKLALAFARYHAEHKHFPTATVVGSDGKTPQSWRVAMLPYLERKDLFDRYQPEERWDSPANRKVLEQMPDVFRSPYDDPKSTNSGYFAVVWAEGAFDGKKGVRLDEILNPQNTLLLVEAKREIPWTRPEDLSFEPQKAPPAFGGFVSGQFAMLSAGFGAHTLSQIDDVRDLRMLLSRGRHGFSLEDYNRRHPSGTPEERRTKLNLQRLAVAMNRFAAVNGGRLPPAAIAANGRPPHSWRVELLPYLDREDLYAQYRMEEPWDSPANRKVLAQIPAVFRSPFDDAKSTNSGYFAIVTPRAAFEGTRGVSRDEIRVPGNVLLLVESKREIPWTQPVDISWEPEQPLPTLGGFIEGRFSFVSLSGTAHTLPNSSDYADFIAMGIHRDSPGLISWP